MLAICLSVLCLLSVPVWAEAVDSAKTSENTEISEIEEIAEENTRVIPEGVEVETGLLRALSIIPEEIDFSSDITREETAVVLCKMLGKESVARSSANVRYYEDVSANAYSLGYINVVTNEGLFSGRSETMFDPTAPITYAELSKLLVMATGYHTLGERKGGFPGGYISAASQLKILKDVNLTSKSTVSWTDAIQMVFNAMQVDILSGLVYTAEGSYIELGKSQGDNILKLNHNVYASKGQITGTAVCKIFGTGLSRELEVGEIEINGLMYSYDPEKIAFVEGLTGYRTEYFYKELSEDDFELVYAYVEDSTSISLMSYDITKVYGFDEGETGKAYIEYFIDDLTMDEAEKVSLAPRLALIVNNEKTPKVTNSDLKPECGRVTLIDSDDDGVYDVAIVVNYDMKIVDVVSMYDKHIFFKSNDELEAATPLVLNDKYVDVEYNITKGGKRLFITDLREGDILGIIVSERGKKPFYQIEVLSSYVEGIVEQFGSDGIVVDGVTYGVSADFDFEANDIKPGDKYKLYFDFKDELFFAETQEDPIPFEYLLLGVERMRGGRGKIRFKMCYHATYTGKKVKIYDAADEVNIDGKKYSGAAIADALRLSDYESSNTYGQEFLQPLKYVEFDEDHNVTKIVTVEEGLTHPLLERTYVGEGTYDEAFRDEESGEKIDITYKTQFFYIPIYSSDDANWIYGELSQIRFYDSYITNFWGEDENGYPEAVFVYHSRKSGETDFLIDDQRPMLVTAVKKLYDADDKSEKYRIETLNSGGTFVYISDERNSQAACFSDLRPGDVVFAALTGITGKVAAKVTVIAGGEMWSCLRQARLSDFEPAYFKTLTQMYGKVDTIRPEPRLNRCAVNVNVGDIDGDGEDNFQSLDITGVPLYYYDRGDDEACLATYAAIKSVEVYGEKEASDIYVCYDEEQEPNMVVIVGEK